MNEEQPERIEVTTNSEQAQEFMEKLATDDAFRAELEADPQTVLARHGIEATSGLFDEPTTLPPKEDIDDIRVGMLSGEFSSEAGAALLESDLVYFAFRIFRAFRFL